MKKFLCAVLTLIISILICLLCVSYGVKDACVNTISNTLVKREITSKIVLSVEKSYPEASFEALEDIEKTISNNASINELTTKYFDEIINSIVNEEEVKAPNTKEELLSLINDNEAILKEHGIEVTEEQKNKVVNEIIDSNIVNTVYEKVTTIIKKDLNDNQKTAVSMYQTLTSKTFRTISVIAIIIMIMLIALIKKTFYRFSINVGIASILSGVVVSFIIPLVVNMFGSELTNKLLGESSTINVTTITNYGYVCFIVGAVFIIVHFVCNKLVNYKEKSYED